MSDSYLSIYIKRRCNVKSAVYNTVVTILNILLEFVLLLKDEHNKVKSADLGSFAKINI